MLKRFTSRSLMVLAALLSAALSMPANAQKALQTFTLTESFGVSHPEQIVLFPCKTAIDPRQVVLQDEHGRQVPFQLLHDRQLAVRTDLPAGATRTWALVAGTPQAQPAGVSMSETAQYYEITNALVGIRVPKAPADLSKTPSPIQGLRYQDGVWTAQGPNWMARPAKSMRVDILEQGPLLIRLKVNYLYDRALLHSHRAELPDVPAGESPYSTTIEVQAGQPSILFEEECATDISYQVDISTGLQPDRAQYRGHHATSAAAGSEPDGKVYMYNNNNRHDALVLLKYDGKAKDRWSQTSYPFMSHWDPWAVDTGFYWQLYAAAPDAGDNLFGIFAGPAARLIDPGLSGVSFDTRLEDGKQLTALQVRFQRLMPTQMYTTHMRFGWGIFLGKKSVDLKPQLETQGINRQLNIHSGINLTKLAALPVSFPDLPQGYGCLYAPATAWKGVADALHAEHDKGGNKLFGQQYQANSYLKSLLEYWANPTPAVAKKAADEVIGFAHRYLDTQVNGEGIYQHSTHYFMGASNMSGYITWIDQLLASDQVTPETKTALKQTAALFGSALWDDDVSPMQEHAGVNLGPANMSAMWRGTRYTYTLFLANHPLFQPRVEAVRREATELLHGYVNDAGACTACAHYSTATMVPILNLLQQLQMSQVADIFATDPLLERYAEWEMQLMTPPEVRFGGLRKLIAVGDGGTEQNVRIGQLGTGLAKSHPGLSARVMGAWQSMGAPQDNFYGPSILKIDATLPATSPKLGDAHFEGWQSVMRAGWETPDESAVYFINGDTLSDHRHNDQGEVILYALGAPLSLDFGSMYYPRPSGGLLHSIALPESALGRAWDADNIPLDAPSAGYSTWWNTKALPFTTFRDSAAAAARFTTNNARIDQQWQRTVRFLHPDPAHPVIVIDDDFSGKDLAGKPVITTLNLMAQGAVTTPTGLVTPVERMHLADQNTSPDQCPSAGTPFALPPGLNKFAFTGQWLIDWDLYTDAATPMQAAIGNWGEMWHPSTEQNQFKRAQGRPFEERQHMLRLRGQDHLRTIILPYRKGARPDPLTVEKQDAVTRIHHGDLTLTLTDHSYAYTRGDSRSLTAFDSEPATGQGMRIQGGPAEIVLDKDTGALTLSGAPGDRTITLPTPWRLAANPAVTAAGDGWTVHYTGGPLTLKVELVGK